MNALRHHLKLGAIGIFCGIGMAELASCQTSAKQHPAEVVVVQRKDLGFEIPSAILTRERQSAAEQAETPEIPGIPKQKADNQSFAQPDYTQVHRAEDGTIFCRDDIGMSLWIRRKDHWENVLSNIPVQKTFGGAPPRFPLRYLGNGHFVFSQTLPNSEEPAPEGQLLPTAKAITCLLDARTEGASKVVARGEAFRYDHNPPLKIPEAWYTRSGTTPLVTEFRVVLTAPGPNKIALIKAIRELRPELGLAGAKKLSEESQPAILEGLEKAAAEAAKRKLEASGATIELK